MRREQCYIDRCPCTRGRFSFCDDCVKAQETKEAEISQASSPLEVTLAHIPYEDDN